MKYFLLTLLLTGSIALHAHAASMSVTAPASAVTGAPFAVDVIADTGGVSINSVEASITYPSDILNFSGYQETAGVVRFWIEQPAAANGTVSFAGGIPGGADRSVGGSTSLTLVRLLFTPKDSGTASLAINHSTLLRNDGKGTALPHTASGTSVSLISTSNPAAGNAPTVMVDTNPPVPFTIEYVSRDRSTGTPALITFHATDRDSGIASYRVKAGWGRWHDATSPYEIPSRLFSYRVAVEAVDAYGNVQTSQARIPGTASLGVIIAIGIVALAVVGAGFWRYFMIKRKI
jgi:hypothetical protein